MCEWWGEVVGSSFSQYRTKVYKKYGECIDRGWFCVWSCLLSDSHATWHEGWDRGLQYPPYLMWCLHVGMRLPGHANDDCSRRRRGLCSGVPPLSRLPQMHITTMTGDAVHTPLPRSFVPAGPQLKICQLAQLLTTKLYSLPLVFNIKTWHMDFCFSLFLRGRPIEVILQTYVTVLNHWLKFACLIINIMWCIFF